MKGVEIINLKNVNKDERGSIFQFDNRDSSKLLLIKRKKGTISGGHYHCGKSKMKNPETLVLLDGEIELILKDINSKELFSEKYNKPVLIKINPYIYHEIKALSDIILLDMNSIDNDKDDTIKGC